VRYVVGSKPLYVETPLWDDPSENSHRPDLSVDDAKRTNTGLVTARGEPIMRVQPPVGFGRTKEWG